MACSAADLTSLYVSQGGGGDVLRGACGSQEGGGGGAGGGAAALWVTGDCCEGTTIGGTARSAAAGDASGGQRQRRTAMRMSGGQSPALARMLEEKAARRPAAPLPVAAPAAKRSLTCKTRLGPAQRGPKRRACINALAGRSCTASTLIFSPVMPVKLAGVGRVDRAAAAQKARRAEQTHTDLEVRTQRLRRRPLVAARCAQERVGGDGEAGQG